MVDLLNQSEFAEVWAGGVDVFRALLENLDQCVYLLDREGRCLAINRPFSRWLGRPETEILGRTVFDFWPRPLAVRVAADHQRVLRGERIEQEEDRPRAGKDGATSLRVRVRKVPVQDLQGTVHGVLCLFQTTPFVLRHPPSAASAADNGRKTILVVDNEPSIVRLAQMILQRHGYHVLSAEDGRQAVAIYRQQQAVIDLVLLDQNMPVLSGLETMNELLAINPRVPILLVTGGDLPEPSWGSQTPGWGFLSKPWTADQLVQAVRSLLRKDEG